MPADLRALLVGSVFFLVGMLAIAVMSWADDRRRRDPGHVDPASAERAARRAEKEADDLAARTSIPRRSRQ